MVPPGRHSGRSGGREVRKQEQTRGLGLRRDLARGGLLPSVIVVVLFASFILSARGELPTWGDETFTLRLATGTWAEFWDEIKLDVHPPLYFAISKLVAGNAGAKGIMAPQNVRALSMVLYGLLLWFSFMLLRRRVSRIEALLYPTALVASSAHLALFCPMLRYYALAGLGVTSATLLLLPERGHPSSSDRKPLFSQATWYGITILVAFASSYLTAVVLPAHLIHLRNRPRSEARPYWIALGIAFLFSLPLLWLLAIQIIARQDPSFPGLSGLIIGSIARLAFIIYSFLLGESFRPWDWNYSIPALLAFLWLIIPVWRMRGTPIGSLLFLTLAVSLPIGALALTWIGIGIEFSASRLMFLAPVFLILLGTAAAEKTPSRRIASKRKIALGVLIGLNLVATVFFAMRLVAIQSTYIIPWDEIANQAKEHNTGNTLLLYDDDTLPYWTLDAQFAENRNLNTIAEPSEIATLGEFDRVIIVYSPRDITAGGVMQETIEWLEANYEYQARYEHLVEDEQSIRFKSILLRRTIEPVKKALRVYDAAG